MTYRFQIMSSVEVGVAPGSYRIIDLFCFKEVLNQIMKVHRSLASLPILSFPFQCSCQSANGFGLFQQDSDVPNSFHSILDIVCRNCSQKVQKILKTFMTSKAYFHFQISFGTSIIVDSFASGVLAKPDIDLRIESCFDHLEDNFSLARKLRQNLYHSSVADWRDDDDGGGEDTAVVTISAEQEISEAFHQQLQPSHQVARSSSLPSLTCGTCGKEFKKAFNLKQHVRCRIFFFILLKDRLRLQKLDPLGPIHHQKRINGLCSRRSVFYTSRTYHTMSSKQRPRI